MDIFKIVAFGTVAAILAIMIKRDNISFALMISIVASVIIFLMILPKLSVILEMLNKISLSVGSGSQYVGTIIKIIGIAYAAEFGAQICNDAGESSIASKIELAGKVLIMGVSAPIVFTLLEQVVNIMP